MKYISVVVALCSTAIFSQASKIELNPELTRSFFLTQEQNEKLKSSKGFIEDWAKVGLYIRPRSEARVNPDFSSKTDDSTNFTGQTTQAYAIIKPNEYITFKITLQDARIWGGDPSAKVGDIRQYSLNSAGETISPTSSNQTTTRNTLGIREGFIILNFPSTPHKLQMGRMIPVYGDQRMMGGANWLHNGVSMDGVRYMFDTGRFSSHFFGFSITEETNGPNGLTTSNGRRNGSIDDSYFAGNYNTIKFNDFLIDLYGLSYMRKWIPLTTPSTTDWQGRVRDRDNLNTAGFRLSNRIQGGNLPTEKSWDWTIESAWQFGTTGERINNIYSAGTERVQYDSYLHVIQTGYTFEKWIRIGYQHSLASGDPNRSDSKNGTFQMLFAPRHSIFPNWNNVNGQAEMTSWKNTKSHSLNLSFNTTEYGRFILAGWIHDKAKLQDGWYGANGAIQSGGSTENYTNSKYASSTPLGKSLMKEYDITWIFNFGEYYSLWAGFSYTIAGDAIKNAKSTPLDTDPTNRYVFEPISRFYYVMITAAM